MGKNRRNQQQQFQQQQQEQGTNEMSNENIQEQPPVDETGTIDQQNSEQTPVKSEEVAKEEAQAGNGDVAGEVQAVADTAQDAIDEEAEGRDTDMNAAEGEAQPSATETAVNLVHEMAEDLAAVENKPAPAAKTPVVETNEKQVQLESTQKDNLSENQEYLENVRNSGTNIQKEALAAIEQFCSVMKPRAMITSEQANSAQRDFLDFLTVLLRKREYDDFRKGWSTLLVYFAEYHGDRPTASDYSALSEYSTSRHIEDWKKHEHAAAFCNLISLLRGTRRVETRKADAKRFLLDKVSNEVIGELGLSHLQRFYG